MAENKNDKIKVYVVVVLVLVLVISGYFRIVRGKTGRNSTPHKTVQESAPLNVAPVKITPSKTVSHRQPFRPSFDYHQFAAARNIFAPMVVPPKRQPPAPAITPKPQRLKPVPNFTLKGTIVGGKGPIAIIDNQFVRTGDWLGDFQVVMIGKKTVELNSGARAITLEIMKNE